MSDTEVGNNPDGSSKSSKKNKKRKSKKPAATEASSNHPKELTTREMLAILKDQLEEAKAQKDHKRCSELRDQVWVLTDMVAGVRTRIDERELNKIIESIHAQFHPPAPTSVSGSEKESASEPRSEAASSTTMVQLEDRRVKALRKKLEQIESLKEKQAKGEKLEINQIEKIKSEESLRKEMKELEELLHNTVVIKH